MSEYELFNPKSEVLVGQCVALSSQTMRNTLREPMQLRSREFENSSDLTTVSKKPGYVGRCDDASCFLLKATEEFGVDCGVKESWAKKGAGRGN